MITPSYMQRIQEIAKTAGDANLEALTSLEMHTYIDMAVLTYMYHSYRSACLRNSAASPEQVKDLLEVIDTVSKAAETGADSALSALGLLRSSDG